MVREQANGAGNKARDITHLLGFGIPLAPARWNHFEEGWTAALLRRLSLRLCLGLLIVTGVSAQKVLTWEEAKREFRASNPSLRAAQIEVQESRAGEITAYLRPNPDLTISVDQLNLVSSESVYRPFASALPFISSTYLIERRHKRELRLESAKAGTTVAISSLQDQERSLLFDLRNAFVLVMQNKAVLAVARDSLAYYDRILELSRDRLRAGDIARVDLDRMELQRVQFETDVQSAWVNLRTAKIQLRQLLNDRTPVDQFDVDGQFDFTVFANSLDECRQAALENRPDLRAASQAVDKAKIDHRLAVANGSTDPVIGWDLARDPPLRAFVGVSVTIPLRIFDRNQGEKARTQLDIGRQQRIVDATRIEVLSDVDSAYETIQSDLVLLKPYKSRYLQQAANVRETISFSYQSGGASLLEFLEAQLDYRNIRLNYLNLVGAYLMAANQLNFAVGREILP